MQVNHKDLIKRIFLRAYGERKRGFEDNKSTIAIVYRAIPQYPRVLNLGALWVRDYRIIEW